MTSGFAIIQFGSCRHIHLDHLHSQRSSSKSEPPVGQAQELDDAVGTGEVGVFSPGNHLRKTFPFNRWKPSRDLQNMTYQNLSCGARVLNRSRLDVNWLCLRSNLQTLLTSRLLWTCNLGNLPRLSQVTSSAMSRWRTVWV